jgi:hypothetical protein
MPVGSRIFSSPYFLDRLWGPPNILYNGYRGSFPGVKRPGRETDHSHPASAEVKKMWIYATTPPYTFITLSFMTFVIHFMESMVDRSDEMGIKRIVREIF